MKKIKYTIETGFVGATHKGEFEVEDDTTDEEIEEMMTDVIHNHIDVSWQVD